MSDHELVINEAVMSCCGSPSGKCRCADQVANVDDLLPLPEPTVNCAHEDIYGGMDADDVLGLPVMNFASNARRPVKDDDEEENDEERDKEDEGDEEEI